MSTDKIHQSEIMETHTNMIESLLERTFEYGKISLELVKLKAVDKSSILVSSALAQGIVYFFVLMFLLFLNLGLAFWLGELLGKNYSGFLVVAAFYGLTGIVFRVFMYNWIKNRVCNSLIKRLLN
jgi:hypothetical protein